MNNWKTILAFIDFEIIDYSQDEDFKVDGYREYGIPYSQLVHGDIVVKARCKREAVDLYDDGYGDFVIEDSLDGLSPDPDSVYVRDE